MIEFDTWTNDRPQTLNVKWYRDDTLLNDQTFTVDSSKYFCDAQVQAYNKVVITIGNMTRPYRMLKIFNISDGITRQFYNDELENVEIIEQITDNNQALNINEASLRILPKLTTGVLFQRTLPFSLYRNNELYGRFYIDKSIANTDQTLYDLTVSDYIKILEAQTYLGGLYTNKTVSSLIAEILEDIPYTLDATIGAYTINGYLPIMSKREALRQVAFCINAYVDTSRSDRIIINPIPTTISATKTEADIVEIKTTQTNITTKIELNTEQLTTVNASTDVIFSGALSGNKMIVFDAPKFSLTITGGTIVTSNINYAIISGTGGNVVLNGKTYEQYVTVATKTNDFAVSTDIEKIDKYDTTLTCNNITLINLLNFVEFTIKSKFKMGSVKVGDLISLNGRTCRVMELDYNLGQTEIYADAELETYYQVVQTRGGLLKSGNNFDIEGNTPINEFVDQKVAEEIEPKEDIKEDKKEKLER